MYLQLTKILVCFSVALTLAKEAKKNLHIYHLKPHFCPSLAELAPPQSRSFEIEDWTFFAVFVFRFSINQTEAHSQSREQKMSSLSQPPKRKILIREAPVKYDTTTENSYIFTSETSLEAFADDDNTQFGISFSRLDRKQLLTRYLLKHPNCDHLLRNGSRLWFLTANLRGDAYVKQGELTWKEFLNGTEATPLCCNYQVLCYALVAPARCNLTGVDFMTLEWLASFVPGKRLIELLLKKLRLRFGCKFLFRDTSPNPEYHTRFEERTHYTASNLAYFFKRDANCQLVDRAYLQRFAKANRFKWHDDLFKLLVDYFVAKPVHKVVPISKETPYYSDRQCSHLFEKACFIEAFASEAVPSPELNNKVDRSYLLTKYLLSHPKLDYLLQNGTRLYFLFADLRVKAAEDQLAWADYLGPINNKEDAPGGVLATCFALVIPSTLRHSGSQYGRIELVKTLYPGKQLERFLLDSLKKELGLPLLIANTRVQRAYYEAEEKETQATSLALAQLFKMGADFVPSVAYLQDFIEENKLTWHKSFVELLIAQLVPSPNSEPRFSSWDSD